MTRYRSNIFIFKTTRPSAQLNRYTQMRRVKRPEIPLPTFSDLFYGKSYISFYNFLLGWFALLLWGFNYDDVLNQTVIENFIMIFGAIHTIKAFIYYKFHHDKDSKVNLAKISGLILGPLAIFLSFAHKFI